MEIMFMQNFGGQTKNIWVFLKVTKKIMARVDQTAKRKQEHWNLQLCIVTMQPDIWVGRSLTTVLAFRELSHSRQGGPREREREVGPRTIARENMLHALLP